MTRPSHLPRLPCLSIVVAKSQNNIIGRDGGLPWRLPSDLKHFKATTLGKPVLMGRVTWESLPFPLPGRPNLVLTRQADYHLTEKAKGAEIFTDINGMIGRAYELAGAGGYDEIMLIGGGALYARLLPLCERLYVSEIKVTIEGDAVFPHIDLDHWELLSQGPIIQGPKDDYAFQVKIYERIGKIAT